VSRLAKHIILTLEFTKPQILTQWKGLTISALLVSEEEQVQAGNPGAQSAALAHFSLELERR
jgi:hypothetical protein